MFPKTGGKAPPGFCARRSGHAWGGAVCLEPPLQRHVGARKAEQDRSTFGNPRGGGLLP